MYFDYSIYVRGCLLGPILLILFVLCMLAPTVVSFIRMAMRKKIFLHDGVKCILFVLVCGFLLNVNIEILQYGGFDLFYEREDDATKIQGYISDITEVNEYSFPNLGSDYGHGQGVEFTIDGVKCTAIVKGSLEVGDYVSVVYLPKSGYVLSISEIDDVSAIPE